MFTGSFVQQTFVPKEPAESRVQQVGEGGGGWNGMQNLRVKVSYPTVFHPLSQGACGEHLLIGVFMS